MLIPAAFIAAVAGYLVEPARFWFELPSVTLTIWTFAVPGMLGIAWVGGLPRPVDSLASLQLLAFFTVTVSLISALITVLSHSARPTSRTRFGCRLSWRCRCRRPDAAVRERRRDGH